MILGLILPMHAETFRSPRHIPIPSNPYFVGTADFDGDGRPDFYYQDANGFNVLLAKSDGSYASTPPLALGATSVGCHAMDLTGDGLADVVCFTTQSDPHPGLAIFLGKGDGSFQLADTISTSVSPGLCCENYHQFIYLATGDMNSDGHQDVIFWDYYTGYLYTLFLDGAGHLKGLNGSTPYTVPNGGFGAASIVDLNGDGHPDIAFANGPLLLLGNGDGTYIRTGMSGEEGCHFADIDRDGHVDAICSRADQNSNIASYLLDVLHGNSDGTFRTTPVYSVSYPYKEFLQAVAVRDIKGDGYLDIIGTSLDSLVVLFGNPSLQFSAPVHYSFYSQYLLTSVGDAEDAGLVADYDMDGNLDLATNGVNGIYITYGRSNGTFDAPPIVQSGAFLSSAVVADFNEDGTPDVMTSGNHELRLNAGKGNGTFASSVAIVANPQVPQLTSGGQLLSGDFNGDGHKDVLVSGITQDNPALFRLFLGHGNGAFDDPIVTNVTTPPAYDPIGTPVDLNGDGRDDLISVQSTAAAPEALNIYLCNGDGSFTATSTALPAANYGTPPAAADFNKDKRVDLVVPSNNALQILLGHGDGSFDLQSAALSVPKVGAFTASAISAVVTGDFDHDGNPDIAAAATTDIANSLTAIFVYYGDGHGGFAAPVIAATLDSTYQALQVADLNGDGILDFVLTTNAYAGSGPSGIAIIHGWTGRKFSAETNLIAGIGLNSLAVADFNRDGQPDILVAEGGNAFVVLQNQGATSTTLTSNANPSALGQTITFTATVSLPPNVTAIPTALGSITLAGLPGGVVTKPITFTSGGSGKPIQETALFQVSTLPVGSYSLTASFAGTGDLNLSTSAPLTQLVNPAPSYAITASPTSLEVTAGNTTNPSATIDAQSVNGFTGNIKLACLIASLDGVVSNPPTCSFDTSTLLLTKDAQVSARMMIATTARPSAAAHHSQSTHGDQALLERAGTLLCGVVLLLFPARFRSGWGSTTRTLVVLACALFLSSCSNSSSPSLNGSSSGPPSLGTPAGNYSITVTATSDTNAPAPAPVVIKLVVN